MVAPKLPSHLRSVRRTPERHEGRRDFICLDRNERVSPFLQDVFAGLLASVTPQDIMAYPDAGPFVSRLSKALDFPEDHLAETAGSDAALRRLFMAYLRPGGVVVTLSPSYAMYELYTRIFEGVPRQIAYGSDRKAPVERLVNAIEKDVQLVILAHPDQPIGTALSGDDIRRIVARASEVGAVCMVDEAYFPFCPATVIEDVRRFDNLVVTRSFSKYPGCAGVRLGYAVAQPHLISGLMSVRGGNEVSGVTLAMGCYLLDHPEIAENFRAAAEQGRTMLNAAATRLGFTPLPCVTNFQLLRTPAGISPQAVADALQRRNYLVKAKFAEPIADCIRVTLNGPDVMAPFVEVLTTVMAEEFGRRPVPAMSGH